MGRDSMGLLFVNWALAGSFVGRRWFGVRNEPNLERRWSELAGVGKNLCMIEERAMRQDRSLSGFRGSACRGCVRRVGTRGRGVLAVKCSEQEESATSVESTSSESSESAPSSSSNGSCEQCAGAETIVCPVCDGKGLFSLEMMGTVSSTTCPMCRGKKTTPCPTCKREVYNAVQWWDQVDPDDPTPHVTWGTPPPS
mmetsp:Transcript_9274/g.19579  ORF Transcript_9274/g.19579 Transcript_9274/m.19579 type:complete len:197 (+) Transcript_9274:67-657(+)